MSRRKLRESIPGRMSSMCKGPEEKGIAVHVESTEGRPEAEKQEQRGLVEDCEEIGKCWE